MGNTDEVKKAAAILENGVEEIFESGRFQEYLDVMSRFHDYSARNCILIMMQCPEATHVASYRKWQKEFHRQVKKGEKAIRIFAPVPKKVVIRETNKDTGEVTDHEHEWMGFKAVPVFDISQTEGEELPQIAADVVGDVNGFGKLCDKIQELATVPVEWGVEFTDPDLHGYFSEGEGRICIAGGMSEAQTLKTLVHETAHSILHGKDGEQAKAKRKIREVQAEGVAYVVCNALGVDTSSYSFGYIAGWGEDTKSLIGELDVIRTTANMILEKIA